MSTPETTKLPFELGEVAQQIAETIQKEGSVRAVFGDPVKLDNHTIVPVAIVEVDLGGGGGKGGAAKGERAFGVGMGLGLKVHAIPVGFIAETEGQVRFHAIGATDGANPLKAAVEWLEKRTQSKPH